MTIEVTRREAGLLASIASGLLSLGGAGAATAAPGAARLRLDHIVWAVPDLEEGRRQIEAWTGILPVLGGHAPGATQSHNALASLGGGTYLEVFAPRVAMRSGRWLDLVSDGKPHIASYALRTNGFDALLKAVPNAGLSPSGPRAMGRVRADGGELNWKLLNVSGSALDDSLPFFIDWLGSKPHPSEDSPQGIALERFEVNHPDADQLRRVFSALAIDIPVQRADKPSFAARLRTPKGPLILQS